MQIFEYIISDNPECQKEMEEWARWYSTGNTEKFALSFDCLEYWTCNPRITLQPEIPHLKFGLPEIRYYTYSPTMRCKSNIPIYFEDDRFFLAAGKSYVVRVEYDLE